MRLRSLLFVPGDRPDRMEKALGAGAETITRAEGTILKTGEHLVGATLAHARTAQAEVQAQIDQRLGQATHLSEDLQARMLRGVGSLLPESMQRSPMSP